MSDQNDAQDWSDLDYLDAERQPAGDEPGEEAPPEADLRRELAALSGQLARLERHFETKLLYDQSKDQTIDALHRELQQHRDGMAFGHLRPLVVDLLALQEDLGDLLVGFAERYPEAAGGEPVASLLGNLATISEDLLGVLAKYGFEVFETAGEAVDRRTQRVQGTVPTRDPALDRTVARRLRPGLRYEDRIVRPEVVIAYRYAGDE